MSRAKSYANVPLSIAHLCELDVAPAELIEYAATAGISSVGLRIAHASPGGIEYPLRTKAERAEVRHRIDATGVSVLYIELISISETTRASDYRAMFETGAELGATRLTVAGDSTDISLVIDRFGQICELANGYGINVDFEFMPFRAIRTLGEAAEIVRRAAQPNGRILVDTLHIFRSGSSVEELAKLDPAMIGTLQICDAPSVAPPQSELVTEARTRRLLPGHGGLDLWSVIDALPADIMIGVEVPMASQYPNLDPAARLTLMVEQTRKFFQQGQATAEKAVQS